MTLKEISKGYRDSAELVRRRLAQLRKAMKETEDPEEIWHLKLEIGMLTPVLTQLNDLAELTEHYYDRGYYRDQKYTF